MSRSPLTLGMDVPTTDAGRKLWDVLGYYTSPITGESAEDWILECEAEAQARLRQALLDRFESDRVFPDDRDESIPIDEILRMVAETPAIR